MKTYAHKQFYFETATDVYSAHCEARNTRNGFAHDAILYDASGYELASASCHYLNRSWERYGYQTVLLECVAQLIKRRAGELKDAYKARNDFDRMTAKRREELSAIVNADRETQELRRLYNAVCYWGMNESLYNERKQRGFNSRYDDVTRDAYATI